MRNLSLTLMLLCGGSIANADAKSNAVDRLFANYNQADAPGASVLVMKDGDVVYAQGYGLARLSPREEVTTLTNFRLASVTKQYTAMSIMILAERGELQLSDTLDKFFPEFPAYGKRITVQHLLNHTGGMLDYENLVPPSQQQQVSDADVLALLAKQSRTNFAPGSSYSYSNSGYVVLGLIAAKASGKTFAQVLHDEIFAPLGMNATVAYEKDISEVVHRAYGYSRSGSGFRLTDQSVTSATLGDGGVYTSVSDWPKWEQELRSPTLISPAMLEQAFTPGKLNNGQRTSYGFGWMLDSYRGMKRIGHTGSTVGFRTAVQRYPAQGLAVLVLFNRAEVTAWDMATRVADIYIN